MRSLFFLLYFIVLGHCMAVSANAQEPSEVDSSVQEEETAEPDILPPDALLLGEMEENGVIAIAYIYRAPTPADSKLPQGDYPYLLFVQFVGAENNIVVEKGVVAYKLENSAGKRTAARKMEFKSGYYVASIDAPDYGQYLLLVGCKLEDEKKRQFHYPVRID